MIIAFGLLFGVPVALLLVAVWRGAAVRWSSSANAFVGRSD